MERAVVRILLCLGALGCSPDRTPTWAADAIEVPVQIAGSDRVIGFQTWTVYGPDWSKRAAERHFVCAVVVEIELTPCDEACVPCAECDQTWSVDGVGMDSDCDQELALPTLTGFGTGGLAAELADDPRVGSAANGSWVRYDDEVWLAHGWVDAQDGAPPLVARPALAWPL